MLATRGKMDEWVMAVKGPAITLREQILKWYLEQIIDTESRGVAVR